MAHTSIKVFKTSSSGIEVEEVANILGRPGCRFVGQLCSDQDGNGNIVNKTNKMAKIKPVRLINVYETDEIANWWMGNDGKCGLRITTYEQLSDFVSAVRSGLQLLLWKYLPPRGIRPGNDEEPLRLLDFDGYNRLAEFPMPYLSPYSPEYSIVGADASYASAYVLPSSAYPLDSLSLADIHPTGTTDDALDEYYFGAVFINVDEPNKWCVGTSSVKLKNLTSGVWNSLTVYGMNSATTSAKAYSEFLAVPFFSSKALTTAFNQGYTNDISGVFLSADNVVGETVYTHLSGKYDLAISNSSRWSANDPYVRGSITLSVLTGPIQDVTLHNVQINIYRNSDGDIPNGITLGTVTLYAGVDDRAEGDITINIAASEDSEGFDPSENYVIQLTCDELVGPAIYSSQLIQTT